MMINLYYTTIQSYIHTYIYTILYNIHTYVTKWYEVKLILKQCEPKILERE